MTEEEWLSDERGLTPLLRELAGTGTGLPPSFRKSERKVRLFGVACSRSEFVQDERLHKAIGVAERRADGLATDEEVQKAVEGAWGMPSGVQRSLALVVLGLGEGRHLAEVLSYAEGLEMAHLPGDPLWRVNLSAHRKIWRNQAHLLRDVFGNPFRPVTVDPSWRTPTVVSLAEAIYHDHAFDGLPVLADALEEAGCENAEILNHCRQPAKHS